MKMAYKASLIFLTAPFHKNTSKSKWEIMPPTIKCRLGEMTYATGSEIPCLLSQLEQSYLV